MITLSQIAIRRGSNLLLEQVTVTIHPGQKVGLVGKNGCGKSTLLALLRGELSAEEGSLSIPKNWQIASVRQETPALDCSALDYVIDGDTEYRALLQELSKAEQQNDGSKIAQIHSQLETIDAYSIHARAGALLQGLGFETASHAHAVQSFSGGWRMRLNLAQALLCRSDLLLLDEPTNHLDLDAVIWLEQWLKQYTGTLILISHDRDFLDPVVSRIFHIEQQQLTDYTGNYSEFEKLRSEHLARQQSMYEKQQRQIAHMQSFVDRFRYKATKARQAQSRIKALEKMEQILPAHVDSQFEFRFLDPEALPTPILKLDDISVGYADKTILESVKLNLTPGARIGLLGRNGAGKSTLIKLLATQLAPKTGTVEASQGVKIGYFAQHQLESLDVEATPIDHLARLSPEKTELELRNFLGGFGFSGDKALAKVAPFSGGEKARLALALIVWQRPNLLLLDEPTNHLDLEMRQALALALQGFEGAMVIVSHDRHLLKTTTDNLYLVTNQKVSAFDGDLDDYHRWLSEQLKAERQSANSQKAEATTKSIDKKELRRREAERRKQTQPLRQTLSQQEKLMQKLSDQLEKIEAKLSDNTLYEQDQKEQLTQLLKSQGDLKTELEDAEMVWLDAQEALESLQAQFDREDC